MRIHRPLATSGNRGTVLVWATVVSLLLGALVLAATETMRAMGAIGDVEFHARGQAQSVADAGVMDALAWFRRQAVQPVATFAPRRDPTADPPVTETDDPSIGLVREFEIADGVWGRYEVRPGRPAEPFRDQDRDGVFDEGEPFTDVDGDGRRSPAHGTLDVTAERGLAGTGVVWRIVCRGRVFRRPAADVPLGEGPNGQVATALAATEIRRLVVSPPASAAVAVGRGDAVTVRDRGRVSSPVAAFAHPSGTGTPKVLAGGEALAPSVSSAQPPPWRDSVHDVFGVGWTDLAAAADLATADAAAVPSPLPHRALVVVSTDLVFDAAHPLRGEGVLVVRGDVRIEAGSKSMFAGLLFVEGDLEVRGPAYLSGTVVVRGRLDVRGTGGDVAEIDHDPTIVDDLMRSVGQYRFSKANYVPLPLLPDGRTDEAAATPGRGRGKALGQARKAGP